MIGSRTSVWINPFRHSILGALAAGFGSLCLGPLAHAGSAPASLRLKLSPDEVLSPGQTVAVSVAFADAGGAACPSDQRRRVMLSVSGSGGVLEQDHVDVEAGQWVSAAVTFRAVSSGDVFINARTPGLAASQVVVSIRSRKSRWELGLFETAVFADPGVSFALKARAPNATAARAGSWEVGNPVTIYAILDEARDVSRRAVLEVWTEPQTPWIDVGSVRSDGGRAKGPITGLHTAVTLPGRSDDGELCVFARIVEEGAGRPPQTECLHFERPVASRIAFDPQLLTISAYETDVPLTVVLVNQFDGYNTTAGESHNIELISHNANARVEPQSPCSLPERAGTCLRLNAARGRATLKWSRLPAGTQIKLTARDVDDTQDLHEGTAEITIVAKPAALALLAAFGGCLGGLARLFYLGVSLAGRNRSRLDSRGFVHLGFSGLFGVILFQATGVALGLLPSAASATGLGQAFVLGTVGGYGGIVVLGRLFDQVLPAAKTA